jgi:glutamyl-tRNA reductase
VFELSVAQQPPGQGDRWPASAVIWQTCVREIAFVDPLGRLPAGVTPLIGEAAYAHLLEVICGLDSPMVGETEVLHQFKVFLSGVPSDHSALREVGHQLLSDARVIRSRYLIGLGSRSYGSAVRRYLADAAHVAVAGTGMLAREVVPFLLRPDRRLDLWGRRSSCDGFDQAVVYRRLDSTEPAAIEAAAAIVIAAPLASAQIRRLAGAYSTVTILIDLRAEGVHDPPPPIAPIVSLADVFASVENANRATAARVAAAQQDVQRCARAFSTRAKLNPSGWHDLCA